MRQLDVVVRHPVGVVGRQQDFDAIVHVEPFGMVAHGFRLHRDARHEGEGGAEVVEQHGLDDGVAPVLARLPSLKPGASRLGADIAVHSASPSTISVGSGLA